MGISFLILDIFKVALAWCFIDYLSGGVIWAEDVKRSEREVAKQREWRDNKDKGHSQEKLRSMKPNLDLKEYNSVADFPESRL